MIMNMNMRSENCKYWERQSMKYNIGNCLAIYEDNFPFHCDHPPITRTDFSCDFGREKEEEKQHGLD